MIISKESSPMALVMVYGPYHSGIACGGVWKGDPSKNITTHCHPPGSGVTPDVDHVVAFT